VWVEIAFDTHGASPVNVTIAVREDVVVEVIKKSAVSFSEDTVGAFPLFFLCVLASSRENNSLNR
jgi:hypothetical protein